MEQRRLRAAPGRRGRRSATQLLLLLQRPGRASRPRVFVQGLAGHIRAVGEELLRWDVAFDALAN